MNLRNKALFIAGVAFLALSKLKNILRRGYSPKPISISDYEACIAYDIRVVEHWLTFLRKYAPDHGGLEGKSVLELGPGSDLGTGLYLLYIGCGHYNACDVNDLMKNTPGEFYNRLFDYFRGISSKTIQESEQKAVENYTERENDEDIIRILEKEIENEKKGMSYRLNFLVRDDFDISVFGEASIDLVFSQAAFEHFGDIETTVSQLSNVCKPGAILVTEIDLKTHSRWIRDVDPNNIYRYPAWFYDFLRVRGTPNRLRPYQYKAVLEKNGWKNITVYPLIQEVDSKKSYSGMNSRFADSKNQMEYLSIMLCAQKVA